MKLAILKPIMWNDNGYIRPAGYPSTSGYSHDNGYGHEEWNGNPDWTWNVFRVFHTETQPKLDAASLTGDLGMVMIAAHEKKAFALGVATNVYANTESDMAIIAEDLGIFGQAERVWNLQTVKNAFNQDRAAFDAHWEEKYKWIRWRCPQDQYYWFPQPILLAPNRISGKTRLAMHHSRYTLTTPEVLLDIIDEHLPNDRMAIRDWLSFGDFSQPEDYKSTSQTEGTKKRLRIQKRRNAPTDRRFQYWVEGNRSVEPLHYFLQARFVAHLKAKGIDPKENDAFIDVKYTVDQRTTFCEIKPTDNVETRYAIRAAIGQLLEYRFKHKGNEALEIVLGKKPTTGEIAFVTSLGMSLSYWDEHHDTFQTVKPSK